MRAIDWLKANSAGFSPVTSRLLLYYRTVFSVQAVLVWLNYKNAYEYWTEQRLALNKEVQIATQKLLFKLPLPGQQQPTTSATTSASERGTLFLQLTVDDLGICLPMNQQTQVSKLDMNNIRKQVRVPVALCARCWAGVIKFVCFVCCAIARQTRTFNA
jgi:hypothetical protein